MKSVVLAMAVAGALTAGAANAQSGADVLKSKGCVNCHEADKKKVGPSFKDIAAKGKGREAEITAKLKEGRPPEGCGLGCRDQSRARHHHGDEIAWLCELPLS